MLNSKNLNSKKKGRPRKIRTTEELEKLNRNKLLKQMKRELKKKEKIKHETILQNKRDERLMKKKLKQEAEELVRKMKMERIEERKKNGRTPQLDYYYRNRERIITENLRRQQTEIYKEKRKIYNRKYFQKNKGKWKTYYDNQKMVLID